MYLHREKPIQDNNLKKSKKMPELTKDPEIFGTGDIFCQCEDFERD